MLIRTLSASLFLTCGVVAQNLLPNPGFETTLSNAPVEWKLSGRGTLAAQSHSGQRAVAVQGSGSETSSTWRSTPLPLHSGGLYRLSFFARRDGATGGSIVSGVSGVNRDFHASDSWSRYSFVFSSPNNVTNAAARFGEWKINGQLLFDDAELLPVRAVHAPFAKGELGDGESIHGGVYQFSPQFSWQGGNYHRPLADNRASFNSDRWVFVPNAQVTYRLGLTGIEQASGAVRVGIGYLMAGELAVEASRDGRAWQQVAMLGSSNRSASADLPASLFPAETVMVRLRAVGQRVNLQVNSFEYRAPVRADLPDVDGRTDFLAVTAQDSSVAMRVLGVQLAKGSGWAVHLGASNTTPTEIRLRARATIGATAAEWTDVRVAPQAEQDFTVTAAAKEPGTHEITVEAKDQKGAPLFAGTLDVQLPALLDPRPGHWISASETLGTWWCESGWKIGAARGMPDKATQAPLLISAARGEYEPVQVVLSPARDGQVLAADVVPFRNDAGQPSGIDVTIDEVAYVRVTKVTDASCARGDYPDPLPPLQTPLRLRGGKAQPLWITVHIPTNAAAGTHTAELSIKSTLGDVRVPLSVRVYDFALPAQTHLRSAFGLGTAEINRYHKLKSAADREAVYEKYLQNFAAHRISPYSFYDYAPMDVRFVGQGTNKHAQIDFRKFDAAAEKWLRPDGFSTFQLRLKGMGGGTFESRSLGKLEGFEEGTPEHARLFRDYLSQVEKHLAARGWLDKAFTYWFDEPDRKDYEFVVAGMKRLKAAAPGLKRMLTEQPEPELLGHVDIWCGLTPEWTREKVAARRAAGEKVWWYICTGPKAPYVTEFIDHPGTELRLWPWQSWQYGVEGVLVWASIYWNSGAAFPAPKVQDPWGDPMSYVSGYSLKPGQVGYWGNGDGRFLYPPRRDPNMATNAVLDAPINSVRWENLRDGVEDYEYFWMLNAEIQRLRGRASAAAALADAEKLLRVPDEISADLTHFTTDPRLMLVHRDRIARAIERLKRL